VVAQDGSGTHKTINDALAALDKTGGNRRNQRVIVYVKAGVYNEKVVIKKNMEKLMFVGDGIDRTIVTGNRNAKRDGYATHETATFGNIIESGAYISDCAICCCFLSFQALRVEIEPCFNNNIDIKF
jgi:pectin methylesterase-like acyl-CoA thioesterase